MSTKRFAITITISGLALAVCGCGDSAGNKAGSAAQKGPVVLRMADGIAEETLSALYADEVARRSHGSLRIEVKTWRDGEAKREEDTIADVKAGKADMGFDATRGFADAGVTAFDALHAPLLVDSYALEGAILRDPLVLEMLKGLEPVGVVGLGILPGPLRRPLGLTRPFVSPSDYRGRTIGVVRSRVARATLRALGGTATEVPAGADNIADYALDGLESNPFVIDANGFDSGAAALTANVVLWARPEVLYINRQAYDGLTESQRKLLGDAAGAVLEPALEILRSQDAEASQNLCDRSLRFVTGDVAALKAAVGPAYASLDARTKGFVKQIRALAREVTPEPAPACGTAATGPSAGVETPVDGSYRMRISRADAAAREPGGAEPTAENYGDFRYELERGVFRMTQKGEGGRMDHVTNGTYVVDGDRLTITITRDPNLLVMPNGADARAGGVFHFRWSLYRDELSLRPWNPQPGGYPGGVWTRER